MTDTIRILRSPEGDTAGGAAPAPVSTPAPVSAPAPAAPAKPAPASVPPPRPGQERSKVRPDAGMRFEDSKTIKPLKFAQPDSAPAIKPVAKPAAKSVVPKLGDAVAPESAPVKRGPGRPPLPKTIEIDGVKYTEEQIRELKHKAETPPPAPTPAPAPPAPAPAPSEGDVTKPAQAQTPEEKAATLRRDKDAYIQARIAESELPDVSAEDLDTLFSGGPESVSKFNEIRKRDAATAQLQTLTDLQRLINPIFQGFEEAIVPLLRQQQNIIEFEVAQEFAGSYPELSARHGESARDIALKLLKQFPKECEQMTRPDFIKEVALQTEHAMNLRAREFGYNTWREVPAKQQAQIKAATPAPAPAPAPAATEPAPPPPALKPNSSFSASGGTVPTGGGDFQARAAASLRPALRYPSAG